MEAIYEEELNGCRIRILHDNNPETPAEWGDNNLFLVHYHRSFHIMNDAITEDDAREFYQGNPISQQESYHIFPVAAYIHSGVHLSIGDGGHYPDYRWDVSHVGLVLASKSEWPDESDALKVAQSLITTWNDYLSGNVWGYIVDRPVKCEVCGHVEWEDLDSCWGYYGDYDDADGPLERARASAKLE